MKSKIKWIFIASLLAVFFIFLKKIGVQIYLQNALVWIDSLGFWGWAAFIGIYIFACIFLLPGSILTLGAGVLFGVFKGSFVVSIASIFGASAAFLMGRTLARNWISEKTKDNAKLSAVDKAIQKEGWKIVLLARLSPVFPFNLLNYFFGVTKVSFKDYFFSSWIGMFPGTVMYVYIGSLAGSLANLSGQTHSRTWGEWVLYVVGLLATVLVTIYVTRLAKKVLDEKIKYV